MKLNKILALSITGFALTLSSGCQNGGRFLNQIEEHIQKESDASDEMVNTLRGYKEEELAKPRLFRQAVAKAKANDEQNRIRLRDEVTRYLRNERTAWPTISPSLEEEKMNFLGEKAKRKWPGEGE